MITVAIQKGSTVYVYGENNRILFTQYGELYGFTSNTVSVKKNSTIYVYNANGRVLSTHYVH